MKTNKLFITAALFACLATFSLCPFCKMQTYDDTQAQQECSLHSVVSKDQTSKVCLSYQDYGESKIFKTDIQITVTTGEQSITIKPTVDGGYSPTLFFGDFLGNGLEQIMLSLNSGGSGAYSYIYVYAVKNNEIKTIFDYQNYNIDYKTEVNDHVLAIYNQKQSFLMDIQGKTISDMPVYISSFNTALPYYNIPLERYYLITLQKIVGGFEANTYGYVANYIELNEKENIILSGGVMDNFAYGTSKLSQ